MHLLRSAMSSADGQAKPMRDADILRVIAIDQTLIAAWDDYARSRPDFGSMHHAAWLQILSECSAVQPIFLAAIDRENRFCGVMPCYRSSSIFSGRHIATLRGGVVANSPEIAENSSCCRPCLSRRRYARRIPAPPRRHATALAGSRRNRGRPHRG